MRRLLVFVAALWLAGAALAQPILPVPKLTARVIDQTGTLTPAQVDALTAKLAAIETQRGSQVVLLMVPTTAPEDIASFGFRVADEWKVGRRDVGDGLVIIVSKNDRRVNIEVARTLEGAVPDVLAGRIISEQIKPAFKAGDYAGGLNAAIQLKRSGIPFTVIEKNADVGGTWFENRYPGCRVDTQSRSYTNLFGVDYSYPYPYCPASENERYFHWIADRFELRDDILFETEVQSAAWDETASEWQVTIDGPDGERVLRANGIITAVGFLNRPKLPDIEGMSDFRGPSFHSARWPET